MPRVKRGPKRKNRRKKILKLASGYYGAKSRLHRVAKEQIDRSGATNSPPTTRNEKK